MLHKMKECSEYGKSQHRLLIRDGAHFQPDIKAKRSTFVILGLSQPEIQDCQTV